MTTKSCGEIRWMIRRDHPEVVRISEMSFAGPLTKEELEITLARRNCIGTVFEGSQKTIHGYMIYELHGDYLKVLQLAVAPGSRRTGVGRAMIERLTSKLSQQRRQKIKVQIEETNLGAQLFLAACCFRAVGMRGEMIRFEYREPEYKKLRNHVDGGNRISQYDW